ncbi:Uncharacterised protein [Candidatus Venteria ishoeyi]|uniref:Uncharacterized protein n=1 Tax=Candidatus Venteria ishoeyi TaxID=1899563 RepID=A0A1H6F4Q7_9GAMM|nr:Uncharacterised protein [Candidatus Venteria ishoeyi]
MNQKNSLLEKVFLVMILLVLLGEQERFFDWMEKRVIWILWWWSLWLMVFLERRF